MEKPVNRHRPTGKAWAHALASQGASPNAQATLMRRRRRRAANVERSAWQRRMATPASDSWAASSLTLLHPSKPRVAGSTPAGRAHPVARLDPVRAVSVTSSKFQVQSFRHAAARGLAATGTTPAGRASFDGTVTRDLNDGGQTPASRLLIPGMMTATKANRKPATNEHRNVAPTRPASILKPI